MKFLLLIIFAFVFLQGFCIDTEQKKGNESICVDNGEWKLEKISKSIDNPFIFSYNPNTNIAVCLENLIIRDNGNLFIGRENFSTEKILSWNDKWKPTEQLIVTKFEETRKTYGLMVEKNGRLSVINSLIRPDCGEFYKVFNVKGSLEMVNSVLEGNLFLDNRWNENQKIEESLLKGIIVIRGGNIDILKSRILNDEGPALKFWGPCDKSIKISDCLLRGNEFDVELATPDTATLTNCNFNLNKVKISAKNNQKTQLEINKRLSIKITGKNGPEANAVLKLKARNAPYAFVSNPTSQNGVATIEFTDTVMFVQGKGVLKIKEIVYEASLKKTNAEDFKPITVDFKKANTGREVLIEAE